MKLELKHLAPYLPYKINYFIDFEDGDTSIWELEGLTKEEIFIDGYDTNYESKNCKPVLRPLSDLTKEIDYNGDRFYPYNELKIPLDLSLNMDYRNINNFPYKVISKMIEWHFDVFGLIDKGLAINMNEL
ncbi:hypothetical protein [Joostella sp.]|uniref:hypothetical protein n=1 Tax=Joostella sp. TaxID=2231138 RepID=UPI003A950EC5